MKPPPTVLHTCFQCLDKIAEIKWLFIWWVAFCCRFSYCKSLQSLPFLWWVDFVHKQSNSYLRTREKKDKRYIYPAQLAKLILFQVLFQKGTLPVPCWSDHRILWCTPSLPVCLSDGWLYLMQKHMSGWRELCGATCKMNYFISSQPNCDF